MRQVAAGVWQLRGYPPDMFNVYLMEDVLIEPLRAPLVSGFYKVKEAAINAGAVGCTLSGSGPAMLAALVKHIPTLAFEPNVVPGFADFTIDVRATTEEGVRELESVVEATVTRIAGEERVEAELEQTFALEPLELDSRLVDMVERAAISEGATFTRMPSGAGHDAMVVGRHVPAAMIFVPSRGGISHSPEEYTHPSQLELGMRVLAATLRQSLRSE